MQDDDPHRRIRLFIDAAFQLVDGPEEERALDDVDGDLVRQRFRGVLHHGIMARKPENAWMGQLEDEQDEREQHAQQDGMLQRQQQGGGKGDQQDGAVDARGLEAEPQAGHIHHPHADGQQHAAQSGKRQPAHEGRDEPEHGQGQQAGKYRGHARARAGGHHQRAAAEGTAAHDARRAGRRHVAEPLPDEFLTAVEAVAFEAGQLLAGGKGGDRAHERQRQGRHEKIPIDGDVQRQAGDGRDDRRDGPHQGHALVPGVDEPGKDARSHQGQQGGGQAAGDAPAEFHEEDAQGGDAHAPDVYLIDPLDGGPDRQEKAAGVAVRQAEHGFDLAGGDEQGRTRGKGLHDGLGDEVGQIAQPGQPHGHLDHAAEQGDGEDAGHLVGGRQPRDGHAAHRGRADGGEQDDGRGVGGPGGKEAAGAPERRHHHRQHAGVDAVLRMHAGHERVGHGLRHGHGRDRQRRHEIGAKIGRLIAFQLFPEGQ